MSIDVDSASMESRIRLVSSRIDRIPPNRYTRAQIIKIAVGGWFEFYELFMAGYIALGLVKEGLFVQKGQGLFDPRGYAAFTAAFFLGMFISTVVLSQVADIYGRKATFTWSMIGYSVFALLVAVSPSAGLIDIFRFFAGFAVGIQLINNDAFMSEISPAKIRGRYMSLGYIFVLTSIPIVALLAFLLVPYSPLGLQGWRWVMIIGAIGGVIVWLLRRSLPESPRWLAAHGRIDEAEQTLSIIEDHVRRVLGHGLPETRPGAMYRAEMKGSWREIFTGIYGKRVLMLSVFQFAQTIAVFGFATWAPLLLVDRGFTLVKSLSYSFLIAIVAPFGAALSTAISERVERKWQLVAAALGIAVFGIIFGIANNAALVLIGGAGVSFCNNWLIGTFHPYNAELFPTRIRARAVGFAFSWSRISSIFVSYWVADIAFSFGVLGVFIFIGIAMIAIIVAVGVFGPKTNGRTVEEIAP